MNIQIGSQYNNETWKNVSDNFKPLEPHEKAYVSSLGRVWLDNSKKELNSKHLYTTSSGSIIFRGKGYSVGQLLAKAFRLPNYEYLDKNEARIARINIEKPFTIDNTVVHLYKSVKQRKRLREETEIVSGEDNNEDIRRSEDRMQNLLKVVDSNELVEKEGGEDKEEAKEKAKEKAKEEAKEQAPPLKKHRSCYSGSDSDQERARRIVKGFRLPCYDHLDSFYYTIVFKDGKPNNLCVSNLEVVNIIEVDVWKKTETEYISSFGNIAPL